MVRNGDIYSHDHPLKKRAVDCCKLWRTCLRIAGTKFVSLCEGISGDKGSLGVDEAYVDEDVSLPIDTLVVDLTRGGDKDDDLGKYEIFDIIVDKLE